jgi:probable F420-dependent oxidoreductase
MDDVISATPFLDGVDLLAFAAAITERVSLGTAVIVIPRHNPALLAKQLATIDNISNGRLVVGIGLGHDDERVSGLSFPTRQRASRLEEAIAVITALWTEPEASYQGRHWSFSRLPMEPKPVQRPHPPIWLGGSRPGALRRAARIGDGWIGAGSSTTEEFSQQAILLREALEELGRDPADFHVSKRMYIAVGDDVDTARERVTRFVDGSYDRAGLGERVGVYGPLDRCAEGVGQVIESGARGVILSPVDDHLEHLELLAEIADIVR